MLNFKESDEFSIYLSPGTRERIYSYRGKFLNRNDKLIRDRRGDRKILFIRVTISNKAEKGGMIQFGETSNCVMGVTMLRDVVCEII